MKLPHGFEDGVILTSDVANVGRGDAIDATEFPHELFNVTRNVKSSIWKPNMVTCYLRYTLDPFKLKEFEHYARMWIGLVERLGGTHHGYFMPSEGASNIALALFSFPSLAEYEAYRGRAAEDPECQAAMRYYQETNCFLSYERSFFRPVFKS